MISRYTSQAMERVFSDQARLERWRMVELAVLEAWVGEALIDWTVLEAARATPSPDAAAVAERERLTGHDVVAFLEVWTAEMPAPVASRIHRGLTSSDVVDTALALTLGDATALIVAAADALVGELAEHALQHRDTVRIGRTHGQHATLDTWGHRVADLALAADRARARIVAAGRAVQVAKLSGTTGTYQQVPPHVELRAAQLLGLEPVEVATQVVMRDRLAEWMFALAAAASVCEALALEIRLGQRSEVAELCEGAAHARAGSSSMPHKKNPVTSEQICGLARLVRAYVNPILEGVALWHERDLTHSSVERVAVGDAAALTEHVLTRSRALIHELIVNVDQMAATAADATVATLSNAALVALGDAGMEFAKARAAVEQATRNSPRDADEFISQLSALVPEHAPDLRSLTTTPTRLDAVFDRVVALSNR